MQLDEIKTLLKNSFGQKNWSRARLIYDCLLNLARTFEKPAARLYPVPLDEIKAALLSLGIGKGDRLLIHSSAKDLFAAVPEDNGMGEMNIVRYSKEIVEILLDLVGLDGLIMMNTDSIPNLKAFAFEGQVFDYRKDYSRRGWISEMFRRRPDVCRSVHPVYNVTAWGKGASQLVADHEKSTPFTMDENSPWYKMTLIGGKVVLLGASYEQNSMMHMPECMNPDTFPRPIFYHLPFRFKYIDSQGQEKVMPTMLQVCDYVSGMPTNYCIYMQSKYNLFNTKQLYRTQIITYDCAELYRRMVEEMKDGVVWYDSRFRPGRGQ